MELNSIIKGALALAVLFLLSANIILPYFNTTYNYTVTGLSASTTQGIFLIVLVIALIGFAMYFIPRMKK